MLFRSVFSGVTTGAANLLAAGGEAALATAGRISATRTTSRQIQFSLKLLF